MKIGSFGNLDFNAVSYSSRFSPAMSTSRIAVLNEFSSASPGHHVSVRGNASAYFEPIMRNKTCVTIHTIFSQKKFFSQF
jgi:hypothetical protein